MCGVSKSLSNCFAIDEHQGVELLSFPYLQEPSRSHHDFLVLGREWGDDPQWTIINHPIPPFPANQQDEHRFLQCKDWLHGGSIRRVAEAFAHQPLGQVHHWWPSGWRWPHRPQAPWLRRERGCWSFFLVIVARIFFFCWGLSNCQSPYRYTVLYIRLLSYIIFLIPGSIQGKIHRNLCYYRPNCQSQVPPPDHTRPPVFQTCRLAKCAHIHLDWIHVDSMQTSP